ncbi:sensor histidine kinase [Fulvivirgaceae bacterium BMA10]|uniref:histidine kinase n=1 Tax=Splendidivirga corallicola TaxID=3051826 RepID=A0ABT8KJK6_9BACT|nr:sensor histidine kinase [Fulvivirgaceae bacterium BMA10]
MISDFPFAKFENSSVEFYDGQAVKLPKEYRRKSNFSLLHNFYSNLLLNKPVEIEIGEDPLGFHFFQYDYICIIGIVCQTQRRSKFNSLKKKYPLNQFSTEFLKHRIIEEHKLANHKEHIPINVVSQNLHEIRGLNAKVTSNVDVLLNFEDEATWEDKFDSANVNLKKIYVASRLTKFILDNTKFYDPDFWDTLELNKERFFVIHRCVNKIVKIYRNDFKLEKPDLEFTGNSYRKLAGDKEYFEVLIKILVENAYKYSPYKKLGPKIKIVENDKRVNIEAHSYGQIIPNEDRQHIFTKGFRSSVNKGKAEGTGMGLHNAKRLVEKFGGSIQYECNPIKSEQDIELGWNIFKLEFLNTYSPQKNAFA